MRDPKQFRQPRIQPVDQARDDLRLQAEDLLVAPLGPMQLQSYLSDRMGNEPEVKELYDALVAVATTRKDIDGKLYPYAQLGPHQDKNVTIRKAIERGYATLDRFMDESITDHHEAIEKQHAADKRFIETTSELRKGRTTSDAELGKGRLALAEKEKADEEVEKATQIRGALPNIGKQLIALAKAFPSPHEEPAR